MASTCVLIDYNRIRSQILIPRFEHGLCGPHHGKSLLVITHVQGPLLQLHYMRPRRTFINALEEFLYFFVAALSLAFDLIRPSKRYVRGHDRESLTLPQVVFLTQPLRLSSLAHFWAKSLWCEVVTD